MAFLPSLDGPDVVREIRERRNAERSLTALLLGERGPLTLDALLSEDPTALLNELSVQYAKRDAELKNFLLDPGIVLEVFRGVGKHPARESAANDPSHPGFDSSGTAASASPAPAAASAAQDWQQRPASWAETERAAIARSYRTPWLCVCIVELLYCPLGREALIAADAKASEPADGGAATGGLWRIFFGHLARPVPMDCTMLHLWCRAATCLLDARLLGGGAGTGAAVAAMSVQTGAGAGGTLMSGADAGADAGAEAEAKSSADTGIASLLLSHLYSDHVRTLALRIATVPLGGLLASPSPSAGMPEGSEGLSASAVAHDEPHPLFLARQLIRALVTVIIVPLSGQSDSCPGTSSIEIERQCNAAILLADVCHVAIASIAAEEKAAGPQLPRPDETEVKQRKLTRRGSDGSLVILPEPEPDSDEEEEKARESPLGRARGAASIQLLLTILAANDDDDAAPMHAGLCNRVGEADLDTGNGLLGQLVDLAIVTLQRAAESANSAGSVPAVQDGAGASHAGCATAVLQLLGTLLNTAIARAPSFASNMEPRRRLSVSITGTGVDAAASAAGRKLVTLMTQRLGAFASLLPDVGTDKAREHLPTLSLVALVDVLRQLILLAVRPPCGTRGESCSGRATDDVLSRLGVALVSTAIPRRLLACTIGSRRRAAGILFVSVVKTIVPLLGMPDQSGDPAVVSKNGTSDVALALLRCLLPDAGSEQDDSGAGTGLFEWLVWPTRARLGQSGFGQVSDEHRAHVWQIAMHVILTSRSHGVTSHSSSTDSTAPGGDSEDGEVAIRLPPPQRTAPQLVADAAASSKAWADAAQYGLVSALEASLRANMSGADAAGADTTALGNPRNLVKPKPAGKRRSSLLQRGLSLIRRSSTSSSSVSGDAIGNADSESWPEGLVGLEEFWQSDCSLEERDDLDGQPVSGCIYCRGLPPLQNQLSPRKLRKQPSSRVGWRRRRRKSLGGEQDGSWRRAVCVTEQETGICSLYVLPPLEPLPPPPTEEVESLSGRADGGGASSIPKPPAAFRRSQSKEQLVDSSLPLIGTVTGSSAWVGIPVRASVAWAKPATAYGLKIELILPSTSDADDKTDATKCSVDVVVSSDAQRHQWLGALARAAQAAGQSRSNVTTEAQDEGKGMVQAETAPAPPPSSPSPSLGGDRKSHTAR